MCNRFETPPHMLFNEYFIAVHKDRPRLARLTTNNKPTSVACAAPIRPPPPTTPSPVHSNCCEYIP